MWSPKAQESLPFYAILPGSRSSLTEWGPKQSRHLRTTTKKLSFKFYILSSPKRARNKRNKKKTGKELMKLYYGTKRLNRLNHSSGSSHVRDLQRLWSGCAYVNWFLHAFASCFTLGCRWNESVHDIMLPLAHATSEGSDGPAHPPSLARGITAHIHNEGACLKLGL